LVVTEGTYYHRRVTLAGKVNSVTVSGGATTAKMALTGTGDEELLKFHTSHPGVEIRAHVCGAECNKEEAAEDLVHIQVGRKMREEGAEEPWVTNLMKVAAPEDDGDELALIRARVGGGPRGEAPGKDRADEAKDLRALELSPARKRKEKKERKKEKQKEKRAKKRNRRESATEDSGKTEEPIRLDGSRARQACQKKARLLFAGTGLDPKDRVRNKVARKARQHLKKRTEKNSSSSSQDGSHTSSSAGPEDVEESIFEEGSKVRVIAEHFPGALSSQALRSMRSTLLQEIGSEDRPNTLQPVAVAYYRQQLQRRAGGPTARELMTLCHSVDQLLKGKASSAMDVMIQRIKSIEQSLAGSHWSVSQRQEVLPADTATLTALPEASAAQKEIYQEAKNKWFSAFPEGRAPQGGKNKGRGEGKDRGKSPDKGRKGGKGAGAKSDAPKKKDA
jgi:hypothetical protein